MPRKTNPTAAIALERRQGIAGRLAGVTQSATLSVNRLSQLMRESSVESCRQTVQAYLDGKRDPSGPWLCAFAEVMSVNPAWLLTGRGPRDVVDQPSFVQAEHALVDAIAAGAASGYASDSVLSAMSDYRDSIAINAEARCTARIQKVAANVAAVFAQEAA